LWFRWFHSDSSLHDDHAAGRTATRKTSARELRG
jgi:hypothetical protein